METGVRAIQATSIMIVDDDPWSSSVLLRAMKEAGFDVVHETNGNAALQQLDCKLPDLIIVGASSPDIDSLSLMRRIKVGWGTPVVLVGANGDSTEAAVALDEGAEDYIKIPFSSSAVVARIKAILRRTRG